MKSVLVTGGTGSFGQAFVRALLTESVGHGAQGDPATSYDTAGNGVEHRGETLADSVSRVVVFSRDELKQHDMRNDGYDDPRIRWFIGDVRDVNRLRRAMDGVDVVVHAAAMKQVPACEYNPLEAKLTNVGGAANVIDAALDMGVDRVLALGTDKAVDPTNTYGASKMMAEKLFVAANAYSGDGGTKFACTRYGNVISSRGSVLPLFQKQLGTGKPFTITDPTMTRFVLTIDDSVQFIMNSLSLMEGGEVFVPKLPAVTVQTIADAVAHPKVARWVATGVRPGEKRHELLVSENELREEHGTYYVVGRGKAGPSVSSLTAERLDVAGFRALAGLGATLEVATS